MSITVEPVRSGRDLHAFVTLPWRLYRDDPQWIPPLIGDVKALFNPAKNPFFEHGDIRPMLARRDGRVVGRIAAIRNRNHESFHNEALGFFGFFECEDDVEVARALFDAVRAYHREQGLPRFIGPMNPSTNEECGLLVEGFDTPPVVMMTHALPYYGPLVEACGLVKAKDLFAYFMENTGVPERLERGGAVAQERNPGVVVRRLDKKRFKEDVEKFRAVYNSAWEKNWAFVPMTDAEIDHMAKQLKPVIDPGLILIAELDGKPVGFALGLPDLNQAVKHANGRLFPFGLLKILWYARHISRARVLVLGLLQEYRHTGIDVIMYRDYFRHGVKKGYTWGEFSWLLEDNLAIRKPLEHFGGRPYKTYRIYEGRADGADAR